MFRSPTTDLLALLVIVLVIFGPKRLPSLGRQLGHGLRGFKDSITHESGDADANAGEWREIAQTSYRPEAGTGKTPPGATDRGLGPH